MAKIRVDRRKIDLGEPIKKIGRYAVPVELFTDVTVEVATLVVPEGGELDEEPGARREPGRGADRGGRRDARARRGTRAGTRNRAVALPAALGTAECRESNILSTASVEGLGKCPRKGRYERPFLPPLRPSGMGTFVPIRPQTGGFTSVESMLVQACSTVSGGG